MRKNSRRATWVRSQDSRLIAHPPAGTYPSGHAGVSRLWDGQAWSHVVTGPVDAVVLRRRSGWWRHGSFWCLVFGVLIGSGLIFLGAAFNMLAVVALGAVVSTGGPVVAVMLLVRHRLHLSVLPTRAATWCGIAAGILAVGLAVVAELVFPAAVLAGPFEEGAKLFLPVLLLVVGPGVQRDPRIGIWMVTVSGATFGLVEGVEYIVASSKDITTSAMLSRGLDTVLVTANRPWVELLHIVLTAGAAAVIWLAAHRQGRAFTWAGAGAFAVAAAAHSFNDAVITPMGGLLSLFLGGVLIVAVFVFWFRPRVRTAVPPDVVSIMPKTWVPRLPRHTLAPQEPVDLDAPAGDQVALSGT